jgi:hypothetical protein
LQQEELLNEKLESAVILLCNTEKNAVLSFSHISLVFCNGTSITMDKT